MTQRIQTLLHILKDESYKAHREYREVTITAAEEQLPPLMRDAVIFKAMLESERPYVLDGDRMGFNRSNSAYYLTPGADGQRSMVWGQGNVIPDYETVLTRGMDPLVTEVKEKLADCDSSQREFLEAALLTLEAALSFADRCREDARRAGAQELYRCLCRVPHQGAETLLDACVFLKFIIFTLRCNRNIHIPLGRFDKYMRPYYSSDLAAGKSREELLEVIQEFFLSINFDSDLYQGIQKGDDGQSLVLGGCGSFDDFSHLCMEASLELNLIDPKINLRVDKNTPDELYEFATLMTKQGMGFPQYCNDDIVIPGLMALGYPKEDAENYAVAACWEFIIPGKGMEFPNAATMNFPKVVREATMADLEGSESFEAFLDAVRQRLIEECEDVMRQAEKRPKIPSPYLSVFLDSCIASGRDHSQDGAIYNNLGLHGAGISTAADSLAAIREVIYESREITKAQLLAALETNFEGNGALRNRLLSCPKMGNKDPRADHMGYFLMDVFSGYVNCKPSRRGGIFRAGTGSAQKYWHVAKDIGATPDGRLAYQPYASSFSPSLEARLSGPLSCIQSFTGFDLRKICNGGPLTLELHDTVFRNDQGIRKAAMLVKAFVHLGGHQLQLNCVNREVLLDALEHPENHKNLIVRVWGWSGYFNELDLPFKQHIIRRTEFKL